MVAVWWIPQARSATRSPREHGADNDLEGMARQDVPVMEGMAAHKAQGPEADQTMSLIPQDPIEKARLLLQLPLSMKL